MITLEMIRRYATSLPEVEEKTHFGKPGFHVRDKLFVSFHLNERQASAIVNLDQADAAIAMKLWRAAPIAVSLGRLAPNARH